MRKNADKGKYQAVKAFSFYDNGARQNELLVYDQFAQHIACYNCLFFQVKACFQSNSELFTIENFLPFTDEVTTDLVHIYLQHLHMLALHFEIQVQIPGLSNG